VGEILQGAAVPTAVPGVGAVATAGGTTFRIWAPAADTANIVLVAADGEQIHELTPAESGWFEAHVAGVMAGDRYWIRLDGSETYPDPLSRSQPDGVHGASEVVDAATFSWTDDGWRGRRMEELVIYELHVGTATAEGTFDALVGRLPYLVELGVTAIELMPVGEFAGDRNWGYDGVYLFAPSHAYGGPDAMRRLVDAAHAHGLSVILDVVYNHFGPEGNYLPVVSGGRIFTERHHTPWGAAVNYDDDGSEAVRNIVLENVRQWIRDYHVDGLRLDATHAIIDASARHILQQIAETARAVDRHVVVIAEDERNERSLLLTTDEGGLGFDGVWADDAHHVLRRMIAGDSDGYFSAYDGSTDELARALRQGWLYQGEVYAPSSEPRGTSSEGIPPFRFVHCIQNHDQVGNRALGERLNHQVDADVYRAASALLLLTPCTPLLWMGQEWAATSPFQYFTDHPEELGRLVTRGRREEFAGFSGFSGKLHKKIPDPQSLETYQRSKLQWSECDDEPHAGVLRLYRELLRLRSTHPALRERTRESYDARALSAGAVGLRRDGEGASALLVVNLQGALELELEGEPLTADWPASQWRILLTTEDAQFGGDPARVQQHASLLSLAAPCAVLLETGHSDLARTGRLTD
jgi:maltooligosyltrehalose trehalohydrolase